MQNFILGTAGHIDHGKSSLIKALTGVETDRLEEEKRRGISIVLGYASMVFPSGIFVGIVDVPGHAKFIKTMVSGSMGMDGVLLTVAADDGIMAQTREHLLILKLLGVRLIIPVITKIDLVPDEIILKRESEVKDFLKSYGYVLAVENIIKVSVKSRAGIDELKSAIERTAKEYNSKTGGEAFSEKIFLPIDRIITSKGFGTILAGTLKHGRFSSGDEIEIMPSGLISKIKSIESHNKIIETAEKSMRIAVNIPPLKKRGVNFGDVISAKGSLAATNSIFTKFFYDFENKKELKSYVSLSFMTGGVSVSSKIIILNQKKRVVPGDYAYALFKLNNEISTMNKERFIVRDTGAGRTIGGGIIIDPSAGSGVALNLNLPAAYMVGSMERLEQRVKSVEGIKGIEGGEGSENSPKLPDLYKLNELYEGMISDKAEDAVYSFIRASNDGNLEDIYKRLNLERTYFINILEKLKAAGRIASDDKNKHAFAREYFEEGRNLLLKFINEKNVLSVQELYNIFSENMKHRNGSLFEAVLDYLLSKKYALKTGGNIISKEYGNITDVNKISLPQEYTEIAEKIEKLLKLSGNGVPDYAEIEKKINSGKKALNFILSIMVKQGRLVRVKNDIYYLKGQIDDIKAKLEDFFLKEEKLEPKNMKEIAGVSRKYAIPLLEYFDNTGYTVKKGDYRIKNRG